MMSQPCVKKGAAPAPFSSHRWVLDMGSFSHQGHPPCAAAGGSLLSHVGIRFEVGRRVFSQKRLFSRSCGPLCSQGDSCLNVQRGHLGGNRPRRFCWRFSDVWQWIRTTSTMYTSLHLCHQHPKQTPVRHQQSTAHPKQTPKWQLLTRVRQDLSAQKSGGTLTVV